MSYLNFLLIEDEPAWQQLVQKLLERLGPDVRVTPTSRYREALDKIDSGSYDLAVVDLSLMPITSDVGRLKPSDFQGLELMKSWRGSKENCGRGLIVLSGYGAPDIIGTTYRQYGVDFFIDKSADWHVSFLDDVRDAILKGRLRHAALLDKRRYLVNITYTPDGFIGIELTGPDANSEQNINPAFPYGVVDAARRTNNISELLTDGKFVWRNEADAVGRAWYQFLMAEPSINRHWSTALGRVQDRRDLRLQFSGPAMGLGLPFELLHDGNDYLCFEHILTRRLSGGDLVYARTDPFHEFVADLDGQELHLLIIGANSDGTIEAAEAEAEKLTEKIKADLDQIGLNCSIKVLSGPEATYAKVYQELDTSYYHIIHYSGHCVFDEEHPERSGLELGYGDDTRVLTANQLNMLCKNKPRLRMVNLSCCLAARATERLSRGDFYGVVEAIARAGVPIVLGYRWTVADRSALLFSTAFYDELWRSFSPGNALVKARRTIATGSFDDNGNVLERDDDAWASPVMVVQSRM